VSEQLEQVCGTCAHSILWRHGFVKCAERRQYELLPEKKGCHFTPSRWLNDPLRREAIGIIEICSLDARRSYLERIDAERGKADGAKLRDMVKLVWMQRKRADAEADVARQAAAG
jgi:hypothetical protein